MSLPSNTTPLSQRVVNPSRTNTPIPSRRHLERNSEEAHQEALEQAKRHHARIYDLAVLTLESYNLDQLKAENDLAEQRVLQAEKAAAEAAKARELAQRNAAAEAKKAEQLKEQAAVDAEKARILKEQAAAAAASHASQALASAAEEELKASRTPTPANNNPQSVANNADDRSRLRTPSTLASSTPLTNGSNHTKSSSAARQHSVAVPAPSTTQPTPSTQSQQPSNTKQTAPNPYLDPTEARLVTIHQNCKKMRAYMKSLCDQDRQIKKESGMWRRLIRMSIGQLTGGELDQKVNQIQVDKVQAILKDALENQKCPTPMMNIDDFVVDERQPVQGSRNNDQLPVMFVFLLNQFAKCVINQLALEASGTPQVALSVAIFAVRIFSQPDYLWRGKSLIDIMIAKFRIVCPPLFGLRLDDTTNEGREKLGWKKAEDGKWMNEVTQVGRWAGIAAGYAAICLRDFSKSTRLVHPYGVWHYWKAVVGIVSTPPAELSKSQAYVLKSLLDNYEKKFVGFYGSAAIAVLRKATIELPAKIEKQNDATLALGALATKMNHDLGINLLKTFAV